MYQQGRRGTWSERFCDESRVHKKAQLWINEHENLKEGKTITATKERGNVDTVLVHVVNPRQGNPSGATVDTTAVPRGDSEILLRLGTGSGTGTVGSYRYTLQLHYYSSTSSIYPVGSRGDSESPRGRI